MPLNGGKEAVGNGIGASQADMDRDPSPPVPEDPGMLALDSSKASASNGIPKSPFPAEHEDVMSTTTSVSGWYNTDGEDMSPEPPEATEVGSSMDPLEIDDDNDGASSAIYPMSTYPRVNPVYQVEHPYSLGVGQNLADSGTM